MNLLLDFFIGKCMLCLVLFPLSLREEKISFLLDIMVQILIKQGQVEVGPTDFIPDYSDSVLHHRSVAEDLNTTIRVSLN